MNAFRGGDSGICQQAVWSERSGIFFLNIGDLHKQPMSTEYCNNLKKELIRHMICNLFDAISKHGK